MERYCFYCGKKLLPGERCSCRYAQQRHTSNEDVKNSPGKDRPAGYSSSGAQAKAGVNQDQFSENSRNSENACDESAGAHAESGQKKGGGSSFFKHFFSRTKQARADRRSKNKAYQSSGSAKKTGDGSWRFREAVFNHQNRTQTIPLKNLIQLLLRQPSAGIKEAARLPLNRLIILQVLEALLYFSLAHRLVSNTNLGNWLIFATLRSDNKLNMGAVYLFIAIASILLSALSVVTRGVGYKLAAGHCRQFPCLSAKEHFCALIPGSFYYLLFLVLANAFSFGTGMIGAAMIMVGVAVRFLIDYRAQQELLKAGSDPFFWRAVFALVFQFICLALLFQLLLPNVFSFNFHALV